MDLRRARRWLSIVAVNVLALAVLAVCLELYLRRQYRVLEAPTGLFGPVLRDYHRDHAYRVVHFMQECARYDSRLTYALRPGECEFANREFATTLRINSGGFRDDEESLVHPRIIVLGDSHSMGWGVEQHEAWPDLVEAALGERVLNAAVSSYGTGRELRSLERIAVDSLRLLIIQYSDNDWAENMAFAAAGDTVRIMDEETYRSHAHRQSRVPVPYRFGALVYEAEKAATNAPLEAIKKLFEPPGIPDLNTRASAVLTVLRDSPVPLDGVQIVLFEFPGKGGENGRFVQAVRALKDADDQPEFIRRMVVLDLSDALAPEHYYGWDVHARPEGQAIIARRILAALAEHGLP